MGCVQTQLGLFYVNPYITEVGELDLPMTSLLLTLAQCFFYN